MDQGAQNWTQQGGETCFPARFQGKPHWPIHGLGQRDMEGKAGKEMLPLLRTQNPTFLPLLNRPDIYFIRVSKVFSIFLPFLSTLFFEKSPAIY